MLILGRVDTVCALAFLGLTACTPGVTAPAGEPDIIAPSVTIPVEQVIPDGLYQPQSMSISESGFFCIADTSNKRVVVLDENLGIRSVIGSVGDGPGEFQSPASCSVSPNREVLVLDNAQQRLSQFALESGNLLAVYPVQDIGLFSIVLGSGALITADSFTSVTVESPMRGTVSHIPIPADTCFDQLSQTRTFLGRLGFSPEGGRGLLVLVVPCDDEKTSSRIVGIDVQAKTATVASISIVDPLRPTHSPPRRRRTMTIAAVAMNGDRAVVVHAGSRSINGRPVTAIDIFPPGGTGPVRKYITREKPLGWSLAALTATGDLLILDAWNEVFVWFEARILWAS